MFIQFCLVVQSQHKMENTIQLSIPEDVLNRIEEKIISTLERVLSERASQIQSKPRKLTRVETANKLRVSLPTLASYERQGLIRAQRLGGRRVLFDEGEVEGFLQRSSRA
jgi:hypothetical protein